MARSAATPRVSNHAAMKDGHDSAQPEQALANSPVRRADGSIDRQGLARGFVLPGLGGKCADARSRVAEAPVNVTHARRGAVRGACYGLPRVGMILLGHHRGCQHDGGDHGGRQKAKLCHSIAPSDMKSHKVWLRLIEMVKRSPI